MWIRKLSLIVLSMSALLASYGINAQITMSHTQISDVTPSGFSVLWHASEQSVPRIEIYQDAGATSLVTDPVEVIINPVQAASAGLSTPYEQAQSRFDLQQTAQQKGLNKLIVRGLAPETDYYFKVFTDSQIDSGFWPETGTLQVTTQKENAFLQDGSVLVIDIHEANAKGWLVTASTSDSTHPVSSFVEAGAEPGQAVINLSNLFGGDGTNWYSDLTTTLTIQVIKGNGDIVTETMDVDLSSAFSVANNYPFQIGSPFDALIQIVSPAQKVYSQGENIQLAWTDEADSVSATISLYLDIDTSGEDGQLIASGLAEDPDGSGDQYDLDVSSVTEGSYYVYAVMSDGTNQVSSYGSSKITIDHSQTDGDGDQMSDLWEKHFFGTLGRDGTGDWDNDGVPDELESFYGVNPEETNAPLQGLTHALSQGSQIIGVPGLLVPRLSSYDILTQLGNAIFSISRFNTATQLLETTYWNGSDPAGDQFTLLPGEGYSVKMREDAELIWSPFNSNKSIPLEQGVNVIALTDPSGTAFGLLDQLGSNVIWSIRRIDPKTSLYQTAAFDEEEKVGVPFPMQYGEGYIVTVKQDGAIE